MDRIKSFFEKAIIVMYDVFYACIGVLGGISVSEWVTGTLHMALQIITSITCAVGSLIAVEIVKRKWFNK